jgi:hypothetical protein
MGVLVGPTIAPFLERFVAMPLARPSIPTAATPRAAGASTLIDPRI